MSPLTGLASSDWLEHGFTAKLRKHVAEQHELAFKVLVSVSRKSEDAAVSAAAARYEEIGTFLTQLGKVNANGSDDGDDD